MGAAGPRRRCLIEFDIARHRDPVFDVRGDDFQPFPVGFGLYADGVETAEDGGEEFAESAVSLEGFVGDPGIDENGAHLILFCHHHQIGPQFRFKDHQRGGTEDPVCGPHKTGQVDGAEDDRCIGRTFRSRDFLSGGGRGTQDELPVRGILHPFVEERESQIGFAHTDGMEPDSAGVFFQFKAFFCGENTEPFPITFLVSGPPDQFPDEAGQEKREYKGEQQAINEKHHVDLFLRRLELKNPCGGEHIASVRKDAGNSERTGFRVRIADTLE